MTSLDNELAATPKTFPKLIKTIATSAFYLACSAPLDRTSDLLKVQHINHSISKDIRYSSGINCL